MDWVFICMIAFGITIVVIGIGGIIYNRKKNLSNLVEVQAEICDYKAAYRPDFCGYQPIYKYTYNGNEYIAGSPEKTRLKKGIIGERVTIKIDQFNPTYIYEDVTLKDFKLNNFYIITLGSMVLFMLYYIINLIIFIFEGLD